MHTTTVLKPRYYYQHNLRRAASTAVRVDAKSTGTVARVDEVHRRLIKHDNEMTTLSGGSLGSCVDEERSQLRELM